MQEIRLDWVHHIHGGASVELQEGGHRIQSARTVNIIVLKLKVATTNTIWFFLLCKCTWFTLSRRWCIHTTAQHNVCVQVGVTCSAIGIVCSLWTPCSCWIDLYIITFCLSIVNRIKANKATILLQLALICIKLCHLSTLIVHRI